MCLLIKSFTTHTETNSHILYVHCFLDVYLILKEYLSAAAWEVSFGAAELSAE